MEQKKIGFFLAYSPGTRIKDQGIGRLLGFLLSGISKDRKCVIAIFEENQKSFNEFLIDQKIDANKVVFLTETNNINSKKFHRFNFFCKFLSKIKVLYANKIIGSQPSKLLALILFPLFSALRYIANKVLPEKTEKFLKNKLKEHIPNRTAMLVDAVNESDVNIWFVPTMFWPEIKDIKAKKVVAAPDIIISDFPTLFPVEYSKAVLGSVKTSLSVADEIICYSNYVKQFHLVKAFKIAESKVSVIRHGAVNLTSQLKNKDARELIRNYQKHYLKENKYLSLLDFTKVKFIFYSSQVRPHKNFYHLIKAYEILLRKHNITEKLIITGSLSDINSIYSYLCQNSLQYDVITISHIPSEMLAAFNQLAVCAVNPTLFEGGFPFTFTEAYSVGTPSVMSKIPVVLDEIEDENLANVMLFDPYNVDDMVQKIKWAIRNRDTLFDMQHDLFYKMTKRSWRLVGQEYIKVFEQKAK